ncbi:MAG: Dot/Icm secretion system protein IcmQ [Legionellales bacterium]
MKDQLSDEQNNAVLNALNEAIASGPWEKSNFLKVIGKNLVELRDEFLNQIGSRTQAQLKSDSQLAHRMAQRSNQQEIYISLYSAEGANAQSWEKIVANLPRQMISRPIYADEDDVKALIKTKENKFNEAYVAIFVNRTDILTLSADKTLMDKLGRVLLSLKDKTLNLDNITRFVHVTSTYRYDHGRLIKDVD